jgi:hypothetical protein
MNNDTSPFLDYRLIFIMEENGARFPSACSINFATEAEAEACGQDAIGKECRGAVYSAYVVEYDPPNGTRVSDANPFDSPSPADRTLFNSTNRDLFGPGFTWEDRNAMSRYLREMTDRP